MSNNTPIEHKNVNGITVGNSLRLITEIVFIVGTAVWLYANINSSINDLKRISIEHEKHFENLSTDNRTQDVRLSTLELQVGVLQEQIKEIKTKNETQTK